MSNWVLTEVFAAGAVNVAVSARFAAGRAEDLCSMLKKECRPLSSMCLKQLTLPWPQLLTVEERVCVYAYTDQAATDAVSTCSRLEPRLTVAVCGIGDGVCCVSSSLLLPSLFSSPSSRGFLTGSNLRDSNHRHVMSETPNAPLHYQELYGKPQTSESEYINCSSSARQTVPGGMTSV
jgi:hypothetical protein